MLPKLNVPPKLLLQQEFRSVTLKMGGFASRALVPSWNSTFVCTTPKSLPDQSLGWFSLMGKGNRNRAELGKAWLVAVGFSLMRDETAVDKRKIRESW